MGYSQVLSIFTRLWSTTAFESKNATLTRVWGEGAGNPEFLPGESHGQRSLAGSSPWDRKSWTRLSD